MQKVIDVFNSVQKTETEDENKQKISNDIWEELKWRD